MKLNATSSWFSRTISFVATLTIPAAVLSTSLPGAGADEAPKPSGRGAEVVVVFNSKLAASKDVATHYGERRGVPSEQIIGLDLPETETISRTDYISLLEKPLMARLADKKLVTYGSSDKKAAAGNGTSSSQLASARVRYIVLCYGVPVRILGDDSLKETVAENLPPHLRRTGAAVDNQLALAPLAGKELAWTGPIPSPLLGTTNAQSLTPANGLFMVTRLDGPTPEIARGLVDKAIETETNGLWGRAYFDARGLGTNDNYYRGDRIIKECSEVTQRLGFDTIFDNRPETFSRGFPMPQIAFYVGWYDQQVSGPFTWKQVDFMPGAFAYHLYSFSASTIRSTNSWVGTLLAKGATCTFGFVDEPYLEETPEIGQFLFRFALRGFTFGEAAYASQVSFSWQTTVIGDPLYQPFARNPNDLLVDLQQRKPELLEWYFLTAINQQLVRGAAVNQVISALESLPLTRKSAVLTERLGDFYWARSSFTDGIDSTESALERNPSPTHRMRILLSAADRRAMLGPDTNALQLYRKFLKDYPDYPETVRIDKLMVPIARRQHLTNEVNQLEAEILRLSPPPPATPPEVKK